MSDSRQIVAIGGVSPSSAPAIFEYALRQSGGAKPRVGFLPTASADSDAQIARFYEVCAALPCHPSHLSLFGRVSDPDVFVGEQEVILVGGGNTKSMLGLWREWSLDSLLRKAWQAGTVLAGFSAGAICWFEQALCDSWVDRLAPIPALGLLPGSCCPHYDGEPERRPTYQELVRGGAMLPGLGIEDDCAVHFRGTRPLHVVAARPGAGAYRVAEHTSGVTEIPLDAPRMELG